MAKRGRPRKYAPPDKPDRGTPETQARRLILTGSLTDQRNDRPLGVMEARGYLTRDQVVLCDRFAELARIALGKRMNGDRGALGGLDDARMAEATLRYNLQRNALLGAGRPVLDAIQNLAIYERWPRWLLSDINGWRVRMSDLAAKRALMDGLSILSDGRVMARAA